MAVDFAAIFSAKDKVSKTLNKINKSGTNLSNTFGKVAKVAAGVFSVAKIAQFGKASVNAFATFENGMNEVFTLLPDMSGDAMDQMTQQVKDFAKQQGVLTTETVPALYQALSAGVPKDNVFDFMKSANKAAIGGVTTLETAVDGLSSVVNSYGSDVISVDKASDLMFSTVKLGKTTFEELSASLYNVNPTAAAAGVSFDQVSAALAAMTAQGVPTSVATTQLRQAFVELSKSGTSTDKIFRQIAGKGFKDFLAEGNNVQDAFKLMEKYADQTGVGVNDLFSSVDAGNAVLALTGTNSDRFTSALDEMANAAGATDKAYKTMGRGLSRTIDKLKARIEVLKINLGEKLVKAFWAIYDKTKPTFDKLKGKIESLKPTIDKAKSFIVSAFTNISDAFENNKEKFNKILPILDDIKQKLYWAFEKAKPILIWLKDTGLPAIIDVLGIVFDKASEVYDFGKTHYRTIVLWVKVIGTAFLAWKEVDVIEGVTNALLYMPNALSLVRAGVIKNTTAIWSMVTAKIADKAETLAICALYAKDFLVSAGKTIVSIGSSTAAWVLNTATMAANKVGLLALKGAQLISTGVTTAMTAAQWALNAAFIATPIGWIVVGIGALIAVGVLLYKNWDTVKEKAGELWDKITSVFGGIKDSITGAFDAAKEKVAGFFDWIGDKLGSLNKKIEGIPVIGKIYSGIKDVGKSLFSKDSSSTALTDVPMFAKGSFNTPDTFIAGEKGPELITNMGGSRVFPSKDTSEILSAFNNVGHNIDDVDNPYSSVSRTENVTEKTFNININGEGRIKANGLSKDEVLKVLIENIKPVLLKIIETEKYEEGDLSFDF